MGKEIALKFIQEIVSTIKPKSAKFLSKQAREIELFGEKTINRMNVSDDMIQAFTPFRRLSNKKCTLSEPEYFITKFEREIGKDYLPTNWEGLSVADKVDYIVHERYSRLVANKIMNNIKNEPIEHSFQLDDAGEVVGYCKGDSSSATDVTNLGKNMLNRLNMNFDWLPKAKIDIHNHPDSRKISAFSDRDIEHYISCDLKGYMIDSAGNKFSYIPKHNQSASDAFLASVSYEEKIKQYRKQIMDKFENAYDKYMQAQSKGEKVDEKLIDDLIKYRDEMKILMDDKDLTYMNDILSSEAMSKYGYFIQLS